MPGKLHQIELSDVIDPRLVCFLDAKDRTEAIRLLVDKAEESDFLKDPREFLEAIYDRETVFSTGIGLEVAVPHAKLPTISHFFVAVGVLKTPLEWDAIDQQKVKIVFLIGGPEGKQTQYLEILSQLTLAMKDEKKKQKILLAKNPVDVIDLFKTA